MENVYVFIKNKDGKVEFSKEELDELLNKVSENAHSKGFKEGYDKGYSAGLSYGKWFTNPTWNYPHINSDKITISTPKTDSDIICRNINPTITYTTSNTGEVKL